MIKRVLIALLAASLLVGGLDSAYAAWTVDGEGSAGAKAVEILEASKPTAAASGREVTVSWPASNYSNGSPVEDYTVKRYDSDGNAHNVGSECSNTVSELECTEHDLSPGTWRYSVTPKAGNWEGDESAKSDPVTVGSAKLTLSPTSPSDLPATLEGQVSDFKADQTLTFRLDDPANGRQLDATVSPTPIPADGKANVTVTIPNDVSGGLHTVYAVGSKGDIASQAITLASPSLTFSSSTTLTSLPTTLTGSVANFRPGQTLTFKLDRPDNGTTLTGTANPSTIGSNRQASVAVTIPSGTTNGPHTVYAIGSQGDVASQAITVNVPTSQARTAETSGYKLSDASSGVPADASYYFAFTDGRAINSVAGPPSFSASNYVEFKFNRPLPSGQGVMSPVFNYRFATSPTSLGSTSCMYFEVRRASTGAVLGTHGSATSPLRCVTGSTLTTISEPIPEVTDTSIANDLVVRVYLRNTSAASTNQDLATVSGSTTQAFTLYPGQATDTTGSSPFNVGWGLEASDSRPLASGASTGYDTTFNPLKYMGLTFPAYVPSAAQNVSATFSHAYRPAVTGSNTCFYFEVYAGSGRAGGDEGGGGPIGTHGSPSSPISCNSTSTYKVDSVALPEVDTVSEANALVVRMYFSVNANRAADRRVQQDLATVKIDYRG